MTGFVCDGSCRSGRCKCGVPGVLSDGEWVHVPLLLRDGAPAPNTERKPLAMMTDAETRTMRDSVKTMTVEDASKLPIYDNVRGARWSGMPAEEYFALTDGAKPVPNQSFENIDRLAHKQVAQDAYERRISNAWRG